MRVRVPRKHSIAALAVVALTLIALLAWGAATGFSSPQARAALAASTSEEPPIQAYELDQSAVASIATCDEVAKVIDAFVNDPDPWIPQGGSESSVGLQLDQRSAELCQAEVTPSPTPERTASETASPSATATPPMAEISQVPYRTWAELVANPPRGLSDAVDANYANGELAWSWDDVVRWAALEDSPVAIIELVQNYSSPTDGEYPVVVDTGGCGMIAGSDGCPDPGVSRFVLTPLDPNGDLVPGTGITWSRAGAPVIIHY